MKKSIFAASLALVAVVAVLSYSRFASVTKAGPDPVPPTAEKPGKTMPAFGSEDELKAQLKKSREKQRQGPQVVSGAANTSADSAAAPPSVAKSEAKPSAPGKDDESITNTQTAGVDEGGIVKVHGDHLVILRRGRLFTVKIGDNALKPVSSVDAYPRDQPQQRLV